jgi:hypothetical protein
MIETTLLEHRKVRRALGLDLIMAAALLPILPLLYIWLSNEMTFNVLVMPAALGGGILYLAGLGVISWWNQTYVSEFHYTVTNQHVRCQHPDHVVQNYEVSVDQLTTLEYAVHDLQQQRAIYRLVLANGGYVPIPTDYDNPVHRIKTALMTAKPDLVIKQNQTL